MTEAGYERSSTKLLDELDERLKREGIGTFPALTDPSNTRDTRIFFFDRAHPIPGFRQPRELFDTEKELSRFLWMNKEVMTYLKRTGLKIHTREARIADNCVIDLLADDKKTGELVGIELKAGEADERVVNQAAKYMRSLAKQAASEGDRGARLLIITGQPDAELAEHVQVLAERYGVATQWLLYNVSIRLSEVE